MHARLRKSENAVRTVRLMDNQPTLPNKGSQRIIQLAHDISHPSATLLQMVKFQVSTLVRRAAWSTNRATAKWATLQRTIRIHHMRKATHNTPNNKLNRTTATSDVNISAPFSPCH